MKKDFSTITLSVRFFLLVFALTWVTGCAETVKVSTLKSNVDNGYRGSFLEKTGLEKVSIVFEYAEDTGDLKVLDFTSHSYETSYMQNIYAENVDLYKNNKKIKDCVTVSSSFSGAVSYHPCFRNNNDKKLSAFNGNTVSISSGIAGTIALPFSILGTVLGRPNNPYKGLVSLEIDQSSVDTFGAAAFSALGKESDASCKIEDSSISAWYKGECANGAASGSGVAKGKDEYRGLFKNGKKHGKGTYSWINGAKYEGDFVEDRLTGKGKFFWPNGDRYEGDFVDAVRTGNGKYFYSNGKIGEGFFLNNKLLSEVEYAEYRCSIDPVFASQYFLEQYRKAYNSSNSPSDFISFISKYKNNDPERLIPGAQKKLAEAKKREAAEAKAEEKRAAAAKKREAAEAKIKARQQYRDSFKNARSSDDFDTFIKTYQGKDPDRLIAKAKKMKTAAEKREAKNIKNIQKTMVAIPSGVVILAEGTLFCKNSENTKYAVDDGPQTSWKWEKGLTALNIYNGACFKIPKEGKLKIVDGAHIRYKSELLVQIVDGNGDKYYTLSRFIAQSSYSNPSRSGEFTIYMTKKDGRKTVTHANCASGGGAFVIVDPDYTNVYQWGGVFNGSTGGSDIGIGIDGALSKACKTVK